MEEDITPTVLWSWLVGCGLWGLNQYWQTRLDHFQPWVRRLRRVRPVRRSLLGVLLAGLAVIILYWPGLSIRSWLLPIPALDQPVLNRLGLLLIRLAIGWVVITTVQRERSHRSGWQQEAPSSERVRYWEPYYNQQLVLASSGLLLGLFLALSGGVTAALCLTGWWFGWRLWHLTGPL